MRAALFLTLLAGALCQDDVVNTPYGPVRGIVTPISRVFRGVPYAAPPVNALRWQSPVAPAPWGPSPIDVLNDKPSCPQNCNLPSYACAPSQSEDCLYVNVFTPLPEHLSTPAPVMVFLHGGNFKMGYAGGPLYNSSILVNTTGVIVVVVQYRLGALGFLNLGPDSNITGNYGFYDQRFALQWVQSSISAFGGDPARVSLFGQSAGAMSIATHLISPGSKGLFQAAMLESEPFGIPFRTKETWPAIAKDYVKYAGCNGSANVDACLKTVPMDTLVASQVKAEVDILADITNLLDLFVPWTPTAGSVDVPVQPIDGWQAGQMADIPILIGTVHDEGWMFIFEAFTKSLSNIEYQLIGDLAFGHMTEINKQYPVNATGDNRPVAANASTDGLFVCATRNASLSVAARKNPVYVYRFNHVMSFAVAAWGPNLTFCDDKVCHGGDLAFVFFAQDPAIGAVFTPDEVVMSEAMLTYWTNMAKSGNPNTPVTPAVAWPAFDSTEQMVMLETPQINVVSYLDTAGCQLWDSIGYNF